MPIKMMAVDLDGTLLRSDKSISPYTLDVLRRCRSKGIAFAVATGRAEKACERFLPILSPDVFISNGGSLARCGETEVFRAVIPQKAVNAMITRCRACPAVSYITTETPIGYLSNIAFDRNTPNWIDYQHTIVTDFTNGLTCDAYKLTFESSDPAEAARIGAAFPETRFFSFIGEDWYSFMPTAAGKWPALQAVAAHMGMDTADIAAFGDDEIDYEMVKHCGTGVAMANGLDRVKDAADYICPDNDEDGVAKWLEAYIL